jgi:hypothetical protein
VIVVMVRSASLFALLITLSAAGCSHRNRAPEPVAPAVAANETAAAEETSGTEDEDIVVDGKTEVIDFAGAEEDAGPAPIVVAPPKRPDMPSMMPGVLTGPTGQAPSG